MGDRGVAELRSTIAALRDELKKTKAERKPVARASRVSMTFESVPAGNPSSPVLPALARAKPALAPAPSPPPQPGLSRLSPRKTRKAKLAQKSPSGFKRSSASASAKRLASGSRPRHLTSKHVEASFATEVIPSTVPTSLLPTSFVLQPPSPESRLPPHDASLVMPSAPLLLFPSTTPPFPSLSSTRTTKVEPTDAATTTAVPARQAAGAQLDAHVLACQTWSAEQDPLPRSFT
ncbi:hypothetical protein BGW80DRAFT_1462859 [Lactifluus volemus]|nr:hypothetical protein BGW80DRAFT_1462859 [Lactifluus volemus]